MTTLRLSAPGRWHAAFDRRLAADIGAFGLAELAARLFRLATTVVVARLMLPAELGVAAAALTVFELVRSLANNGIGLAVVRSPVAALAATCGAAWRAGWLVCLAVAAVQGVAALALWRLAGWGEAAVMVAVLAGVYVFMPSGLVSAYLLQREGRLREIAAIGTAQALADSGLTLALALAGFGAWAIVLPKLLTAPVWLLGVRLRRPWSDHGAQGVSVRAVLREGAPALGSEMLATARMNLDKLLVGATLGVEALGIYWFAFNAGIGIALSLTGGLSMALLPRLAAAGGRAAMLARFDQAVAGSVLPICGLIVLQALAVPFYVPLVFGAKWAAAAPVVAVLCASAVSRPLADAASQLLRAAGLAGREVWFWAAFTALYLGGFAMALPHGLMAGAVAVAGLATVLHLGFFAVVRLAFRAVGR